MRYWDFIAGRESSVVAPFDISSALLVAARKLHGVGIERADARCKLLVAAREEIIVEFHDADVASPVGIVFGAHAADLDLRGGEGCWHGVGDD